MSRNCPVCGNETSTLHKIRTSREELTMPEVMSRLEERYQLLEKLEASHRLDLRDTYDAIMELQHDLRYEIQSYTLLSEADYRKVKALAACYELQDYLANRIAEAVNAGELEPDLEG